MKEALEYVLWIYHLSYHHPDRNQMSEKQKKKAEARRRELEEQKKEEERIRKENEEIQRQIALYTIIWTQIVK